MKLSPAAFRLLERATPLWESAQATVEELLGKKNVAALFELLEKVEELG